MNDLTPPDLILARAQAFRDLDFGFIYDSFHSESNFRKQFGVREDYLQFGMVSLGRDFSLELCKVLRHDLCDGEARVIYLMGMTVQGESQRYAELAWFKQEEGGWRYHRAQRMDLDALPEDMESLDFDDFEKLDPKIIF